MTIAIIDETWVSSGSNKWRPLVQLQLYNVWYIAFDDTSLARPQIVRDKLLLHLVTVVENACSGTIVNVPDSECYGPFSVRDHDSAIA